MAFDAHVNFAYATVATPPAPAASGTSLTLSAGAGAGMPAAPFNATVWPAGTPALSTNAEIVRVTAKAGDVLTLLRAQEGSTARAILVGDQVAATITAKTLQDVEGPVDDARLSANVALENITNVFTADQRLVKTAPDFQLQYTGDLAKGHLTVANANANVCLTSNLFFSGGAWQLDDVTKPGTLVQVNAGVLGVYRAAAGANPATLVASFVIDATGRVIVAPTNLPLLDVGNTFTADQVIQKATPALRLVDTSAPADARLWNIYNTSQLLLFQAVNDAGSVQHGVVYINRAGVLVAAGLGPTPLDATQLAAGTVPDARLSPNVALLNAANIFTLMQTIYTASPTLRFFDSGQPVDQRLWALISYAGTLYVSARTDADTLMVNTLALGRDGSVTVAADLYEKGRTTPMGHWIAVPFDAANFSGYAGMTWGVTAGSVSVNYYTLIGKTLTWTIQVQSALIGGTPSPYLILTIPGGFTAAAYSGSTAGIVAADATSQGLMVVGQVWAGDSTKYIINKANLANWSGGVLIYFTVTLALL